MAKSLALVFTTAAALLLSGCNDKNEERNMIKFVDVEKVVSQPSLLAQESEHLSKVRETLLAGKKAAEDNYAKMSAEDAQKSALADKLLLEKSWGQQRQLTREATLNVIYAAVEQYRAEKGITLVAHKTAIIAGNNSEDISDEIIAKLKDTQVEYAALPEVSTRDTSEAPAKETPAEAPAQN